MTTTPTDDEALVERVARALAEEADTDPDEDLDEGLYRWETYKPAARAAIAALTAARPVEGGWRPIETAPKDGTDVLLATLAGDMAIGYWFGDKWGYVISDWWDDVGEGILRFPAPTHWMPLPKPPEITTLKAG